MKTMVDDIKKVVATADEIDAICERLGKEITKDYKDKDLVLVGLLNGCNPFFSDLLKYIDLKVQIDYMVASSYHGTIKSTREVQILKDLTLSIQNKHVVIVDDIIDTGNTLNSIKRLLSLKGALSIEACVLLDKASAREEEFNVKYFGTVIPNEFVVGYGLDYGEYYRNLPYIGVLKEDIYKK